MAAPKPKRGLTQAQVLLTHGVRSGLEEALAKQLQAAGVQYTYETLKLPYEVPASMHFYRPDFILENGIIVESKGRFEPEDRKKHLLVKKQHPELDLRFVFSNSKTKINKRSPTSYADWCRKNGFIFADKTIPEEWLKEPKK